MKKGIFTIIFMLILSAVFISLLAFINEFSKERIEQNSRIEKYKSILYAFNIYPEGFSNSQMKAGNTTANIEWKVDQLLETVEKKIIKVTLPITEVEKEGLKGTFLTFGESVDIYAHIEGPEIRGYGFYLKGKGLWGTIEAFTAVQPELDKFMGIDFTNQTETPGLGARITEHWFKVNFRGLDCAGFTDSQSPEPILMVRKKDKPNSEVSTNSIEAVTGATLTSRGVLDMVNSNVRFYMDFISKNKEKIANSTSRSK